MTANTNNQINSGLPDNPVNPVEPVNPMQPESSPIPNTQVSNIAPESPVTPITPVESVTSNIDNTTNSNLPWQNRSSNQIDTNNLVQPTPDIANITSVPMDIVQDIPKTIIEPIQPVEPVKNENEPVVNLGPELPKVGSPMIEPSNNEAQTNATMSSEVSSLQPNTNEILQPVEQATSVIKMPEQSTNEESPEAENKRRVKNIIFTIVVLIAGVAALLFGIIVASNAA